MKVFVVLIFCLQRLPFDLLHVKDIFSSIGFCGIGFGEFKFVAWHTFETTFGYYSCLLRESPPFRCSSNNCASQILVDTFDF